MGRNELNDSKRWSLESKVSLVKMYQSADRFQIRMNQNATEFRLGESGVQAMNKQTLLAVLVDGCLVMSEHYQSHQHHTVAS